MTARYARKSLTVTEQVQSGRDKTVDLAARADPHFRAEWDGFRVGSHPMKPAKPPRRPQGKR